MEIKKYLIILFSYFSDVSLCLKRSRKENIFNYHLISLLCDKKNLQMPMPIGIHAEDHARRRLSV